MESERQTYQLHNILTWRSDAALIGEILRCAQDDSGGSRREILRCAQDDRVRSLGLMPIAADKSAVGTVNRPLHCPHVLPITNSYTHERNHPMSIWEKPHVHLPTTNSYAFQDTFA